MGERQLNTHLKFKMQWFILDRGGVSEGPLTGVL